MKPGITPRDISSQCIALKLRILSRAVTNVYNCALRPLGLTISQMNILVAVACFGRARQQQVCDVLQLEKSSLSRDVVRMIARRWLATKGGGRAYVLTLTEGGRQLLERATPAWEEAQKKALLLIGEENAPALHRAAGEVGRSKRRHPA